MATILEFRQKRRQVRRTSARLGPPCDRETGEVIIFPGVRIEKCQAESSRTSDSGTTRPELAPRNSTGQHNHSREV